ncbi:tocopherol cyclase family protein [Clostridium boliviensis]|uniref:Tocopherol cyclase family protein n=1 Tax=Clostridium boliviensis TaxID=318465 RepID=A0ABU4GKC3_9CLOT|nr:tocopherol cyclase family protein [Clostridium boliviensis]MDW2797430.1 tocopherol cyclase family protein [Clostridium boliviensis]
MSDVKTRFAVLRDSTREICINVCCIKKRKFFAGWYFKMQNKDTVLALIPGLSMDGRGRSYPFVQVIWNERACCLDFKEEDLMIDRRQQMIMLDNNIFSRRGIKVNIKTEELSLQGIVRFGPVTPIRYSIMGPFQIMPFMECKHEIISMSHRLSGKIRLNGRIVDFGGGLGYIEGDKGKSFPESYLWLQCNDFLENASVMVSVAKIPWLGIRFEGCICVIMYQGKEYRFATYLGARVVSKRETAVIIKQRRYVLKVFLSNQKRKDEKRFAHKLLAPNQGAMSRLIKEEHLVRGRFLLYKGEEIIFDLSSSSVSFEADL